MFFRQVLHDDLGCASYVVADGGEAAVVDPKWEIDDYLELAEENGFRIAHVLETHNHADHVSGRGRLVDATGATVHVSKDAGVEYEHEPLADGDVRRGRERRASARSRRRATGPSTPRSWSTTRAAAESPGSSSPATRSSSATSPAPTSPSSRRRARAASSTRCTACSSSTTSPRSWPGHIGGSLCGGAG